MFFGVKVTEYSYGVGPGNESRSHSASDPEVVQFQVGRTFVFESEQNGKLQLICPKLELEGYKTGRYDPFSDDILTRYLSYVDETRRARFALLSDAVVCTVFMIPILGIPCKLKISSYVFISVRREKLKRPSRE